MKLFIQHFSHRFSAAPRRLFHISLGVSRTTQIIFGSNLAVTFNTFKKGHLPRRFLADEFGIGADGVDSLDSSFDVFAYFRPCNEN